METHGNGCCRSPRPTLGLANYVISGAGQQPFVVTRFVATVVSDERRKADQLQRGVDFDYPYANRVSLCVLGFSKLPCCQHGRNVYPPLSLRRWMKALFAIKLLAVDSLATHTNCLWKRS